MKLKIYLLSMLALMLFAGCDRLDSGNDQGLIFQLDNSNVEMEYLSGSQATVKINTRAKFFKIFTSTDGINVSTVSVVEVINGEIKKNNYTSIYNIKYTLAATDSGYELSIAAQQDNANKEAVVEYYMLSTADRTAPLRVTHKGKGEFVEMSKEFMPDGGAYELPLSAEAGNTISIEKVVGGDWFTYLYDASSGKLKVSALYWTAGDGTTDRTAVLRIKNTTQGMVELKLNQVAPYIKFDKTIVLVRGENLVEKVTVTTNLPQGDIALSDKLEADDPDNRITVSSLTYPDAQSRNAEFTVSVNVDGLVAGMSISAKYSVAPSGAAAELSAFAQSIAVSRSQVLLEEMFDYPTASLFDAWTMTKSGGKDVTSFTLNQTPLTYRDAAGNYVLSGKGKAMQRNYYANGTTVDVLQISPEFAPQIEGVVYMSFIFKLESLPYRDNKPTNQHAMQYPVLGLSDAGTSRTVMCWVGKPLNEETYRFGITLASTDGTKVVWAEQKFTDLERTHLLVLKYNVATKRAELFVNPALTAPQPDAANALIDIQTNNPFNDNNSTVRIKSLFTYDNVKNGNIASQIGGIRVGKAWDEAVAIE